MEVRVPSYECVADIVIDLCTHEADAMVLVPGLDTPVGPGSTLAYVAIVNSLKVRIAQLLVEKGELEGLAATRVRALTGEERVKEVARMLGGDAASSASREHARELLAVE